MKKHLLNFVKAVCFLVVLSLVLSLASKYITPKNNTAEEGMYDPKTHAFVSEPKNSFDVLVIGNSDARCGFSPNELWNEFGYTSYVAGENHQTPAMMYNLLCQFLKNQSPKVVIIETDIFFATAKFQSRTERDVESVIEKAFPITRNHDLWKKYSLKELLTPPDYRNHEFIKGQSISVEVKPDKKGERKPNKKVIVPPDVMFYMEFVLNKCEKEGIKVFFVELPTTTSWNLSRHYATKAYADKHGITFLDMQVNMQELGFDFKTDTKDAGNHLNYDGAKKATKIIGDYLKENYSEITDRRGDPAYKSWDDDYIEYTKYVESLQKKYEEKKKAEKEKAAKDKAAKDKANKGSSSKKDGGKK